MKFLFAIIVIVAAAAGTMYFYDPAQLNVILARTGMTSWRAPMTQATTSATPAASSTETGGAIAVPNAPAPATAATTN